MFLFNDRLFQTITPAYLHYGTAILTGLVLGVLIAYRYCRTRKDHSASRLIGIFNRLFIFVVSVSSSIIATLFGHWIIISGMAERAIEWLDKIAKLFM